MDSLFIDQGVLMLIITKAVGRDGKTSVSKKVHRRVVTEIEEFPINRAFKPDRQKFLDVYSRFVAKESLLKESITNKDVGLYAAKQHRDVRDLREIREAKDTKQTKESRETKEVKQLGMKDPITQRKNFKIYQARGMAEKQMRTQPDEPTKSSTMQASKSKLSGRYEVEGVAGKGTFGVVYCGVDRTTGEKIAIKTVLQDKKYKNREQQIMKVLKHPNSIGMRDCFFTSKGDEEYLNIVMDYFQDNLYQIVKRGELNPTLIKVYTYQLMRGLNYLAMISIAHRDIKPQNVLVDLSHRLVISDFGSAKQLVATQPNLAYICSRCYRAPELIFGATDYSPQIDVWSAGCVVFEMLNGTPPFMGDSQVDQLIEIIKILGTPSRTEVLEMNTKYDLNEYGKFPKIKTTPWKNLLKTKDPQLIDLVTRLLQYSPSRRISPAEALLHEYFDELRNEKSHTQLMGKYKTLPELFNFTQEEEDFIRERVKHCPQVIPLWYTRHTKGTNLSTVKRSNINLIPL